MSTIEKDTAGRFAQDTADHVMTVLHDDGLYRHLRFQKPGSSFYWFELVTWPGTLTVRGDCGTYVFSRLDDMFEFFRRSGNTHGINPDYWAEKTPQGRDGVREYSEKVLRAAIEPHLAEYAQEYPELAAAFEQAQAEYEALPNLRRWPYGERPPVGPKSPDEIQALIAAYDSEALLDHEDGARELLKELEEFGVVSDTWEWNLGDWDWQFLWCCHAIVWGIRRYDQARAVEDCTHGADCTVHPSVGQVHNFDPAVAA